MRKQRNFSTRKMMWVLAASGLTGMLWVAFQPRQFEVLHTAPAKLAALFREHSPKPIERSFAASPLTGVACEYADRRPIAVMLAADPVTRPLSGIGEADVVIEMPVTLNQVTRLMALYQCGDPREIGSIRSARDDFLPLAAGFDALYSHWGGSHFALEKLATNVLDNIDALINPHDAYYRKRGIPGPHNGFTSYERLWGTAEKLGYRTVLSLSLRGGPEVRQNLKDFDADEGVERLRTDRGNPAGSPRPSGARDDDVKSIFDSARIINVAYNPNGFAVRWVYDETRNVYRRFRAGTPEVDNNNGQQVEASVVIVMRTTQTYLEGEYTDVKVIGEGRATIYQQGASVAAKWRKRDFNDPLEFIGEDGTAVPLTTGKRWIEIVTK